MNETSITYDNKLKRYLFIEFIKDLLINFGINAFFGLFAAAPVMPVYYKGTPLLFFGASNIYEDIFWMNFYIGLLIGFLVTFFAHLDVRSDKITPPEWKRSSLPILKYLPNNIFLRALVTCVACIIIYMPLTWLIVYLSRIQGIYIWHFVIVKGLYGMLIAPPVAFLIRISALSDEDHEDMAIKLLFKYVIRKKNDIT